MLFYPPESLVPISPDLISLWDTLLPATIHNAKRTPFYRALYKDSHPVPVCFSSLRHFPLVDRTSIKAAGISAQMREGLVCDEVFTSGTTGAPLVFVRGNREQDYIRSFYSTLLSEFPIDNRVRAVELTNPYHGHRHTIPSGVHTHAIGVYDRGSFEHALSVLTNDHSDFGVSPRCSMLMGLERVLRAFAHFVLDLNGNGLQCELRYVISYAQYLTSSARALFSAAFHCPVIDRFGLSEIFGGATQESHSEWYHFDPCVIPEVISRRNHTPITEGIGLLVLTALYPFQEAQPLVRYNTGDLVEVTHTRSSRPGFLAIRPLGRAKYGVPDSSSDNWLITPADIYEIIDAEPYLLRTPLFRDSPQVSDPHRIGHPRFRTRFFDVDNVRDIVVDVELAPGLEPHLRSHSLEHIRTALLARTPHLRAGIESGAVTFSVQHCQDFPTDFISYAE